MQKKKALWLFISLCILALTLSLCSCDKISSVIESDFHVATEYFDMLDVKFVSIDEKNANGEDMAKAEYTVACATSLYQYTANFKLLNSEGEDIYKSETVVSDNAIDKSESFYVSFTAPLELVQEAAAHKIEITGKSKQNPSLLLLDTFKVTYMYDGEVINSADVRGGKSADTVVANRNNLIFNGWYKNEALSVKVKDSDKIYRDTTYYAKFSLDAEKVTNQITTSTIRSLVSISYTERRKEGFSYSTYVKNGSGIIFHVDGNYAYVLTNFHVVDTDDSDVNYEIYDYRNTKYVGEIYIDENKGIQALCEKYDLACLAFGLSTEKLPAISLAQDNIKIGQSCIALGYPDNQKNAITYGSVSEFTTPSSSINILAIKHTAPVNHGCSGGPLLNSDLELVGINYAKSGNNYEFSQGYAIPLNLIREFLQEYTSFIN